MRSINATLLAALQSGSGKPFLKGYIGHIAGDVIYSGAIWSYKLTGLTLEFTIPYKADFAGDQTAIWLERGLTIAGTDYTVTTGRFYLNSQQYHEDQSQTVRGSLFPNQFYSANGYDTYQNVINAFCTAFGKTAVYRSPGDAWLAYKFFASGKNVVLTDAMTMVNLLRQKRLITMCDYGAEQVLVYGADVMGAADLSLSIKDEWQTGWTLLRKRQYIWKDELGVAHQSGTATDPKHNLGYLEAAASAPARKSTTLEFKGLLRPDLRILDGDVVTLTMWGSASYSIFAQVTEEFNPKATTLPHWRVILEANPIFYNSEGGSVPNGETANYAQVNTGSFNGILSANDNNVQAALDTIDNYLHTGVWTPTLTKVTNVTATTSGQCIWTRIGDHVLVSGIIQIDPTAAGPIEVDLSLPAGATSNFGTSYDASGTGACYLVNAAAHIEADAANDRLALYATVTDITNRYWSFLASYVII